MDENEIGQHKPRHGNGPNKSTFKPTAGQRQMVQKLAGLGFTQTQISDGLGISKPTLEKYYNDELQAGYMDANMQVAGAIFKAIVEDGNMNAAIFWAKARMGWTEKQIIENQNMNVSIGDDDAEL